MNKKRVTFADVAKYTGFSKTTISRYFNNKDSLTIENQEKIKNALEVLGYQENKLAKVLANGKTEMIGVIIPNMYMHYYSDVLNSIINTYETYGYKFIVFSGNDSAEIERKYINELLSYNIEGIIILSHTLTSKELASFNIPIVAIEREDKYICSVNTDNYMGGIQAGSLLMKSGCKKIVHVNGNVPEYIPSYGRIKGFKDLCEENNLNSKIILTELGNTYEENYIAITKIFNEIEEYPEDCIGIFMPNDTHANILVNIIFKKYGYFPNRYKIIGFDNSLISREGILPISTIGQQIDVITNEAMKLLISQIENRKKRIPETLKEPIHEKIVPILFRRDTTL